MGGFIDNEVAGTPGFVPPYSHGGGFLACDRTDLVACSDFRRDLMEAFGTRYSVDRKRQYTDYKEMIAREELDMVSVATHVEHHADIVIHAAENGVKAIYCEKGMAASLGEANAMARACRLNGVVFNMGAQRRFHPGFWKMREIIGGGELGALQNLVMTYASGLFDHGCHTIDLAQYLNGDAPALWVQGSNQRSVPPREGDVYREDPGGSGVVFFANGVTLYLLNTNGYEYQAHCESGMVGTYNDTRDWVMRTGKARDLQPRQFPSWPHQSPTSNLILDLVRALDTGDPPLGGVETARHGVEIAVAILESHLHGGKRIELPLEDSSVRLHRVSRDAWQRRHRWREPKLAE
jgi:predicted dehydrogenase